MADYSIVTLHGLGSPQVRYAAKWRIEESLGLSSPVNGASLYYDDLLRGGGLLNLSSLAARIGAMAITPTIARPLAEALADKVGDYTRDVLSFFFDKRIRQEMEWRFDDRLSGISGPIVLLAHSFGCVVARWYLSLNPEIARRVTLVEVGNPMASVVCEPLLRSFVQKISPSFPSVAALYNVWSPLDPLSGKEKLVPSEANARALVLHADVAGYLKAFEAAFGPWMPWAFESRPDETPTDAAPAPTPARSKSTTPAKAS